MIAANYRKHPEALRFQREMFSNGFHNQPRIMRLMECIFDQRPSAPDWWTAAKSRARALAKTVRKAIYSIFDTGAAVIQLALNLGPFKDRTMLDDLQDQAVKRANRDFLATPDLDPHWDSGIHAWALQAQGEYRIFCRGAQCMSRTWTDQYSATA